MNSHDIELMLQRGEHLTLECKEAQGGLPRSMWATYSAFANTDGGTILLGVRENEDKSFTIVGVEDAAKMEQEIWNTLNGNKVNVNLLADEDMETVDCNGKTVLAIRVPRAKYNERPVFLNENPFKGTYRRNGEGDYHCSEVVVKAMIRDSSDEGNDRSLIEGYTFEMDIDAETLRSYRNRFKLYNDDHVWNDCDDKEFLRNMGGIDIDRTNGKEWLTMAGLLMFGKGLSIRNRFSNIRMDYLDFTNLLPGSRWSDRITYDGRWENNLYTFYNKVQPRLTADLKRPFRMEGITRVDDTPIHKAVREVLTNAIIHSDYCVEGVLRIEKHDDGFVLSNPGTLKLPPKDIYAGGVSKSRNPIMQTMMRMVGMGENIGSGFPTVMKAWKEKHWLTPEISERVDLQIVTLSLKLNAGATDTPTVQATDQATPQATDQATPQGILQVADIPQVTNIDISQITPQATPQPTDQATPQAVLQHSNNHKDIKKSDIKVTDTIQASDQVTSQADNRITPQDHSQQSENDIIANRNTPQAQNQVSPIEKEIMAQILFFCSEPKTLKEIMDYLNYTDRKHFVNTFITPLLGKFLKQTHPKYPKHPNQKYVVIKRKKKGGAE